MAKLTAHQSDFDPMMKKLIAPTESYHSTRQAISQRILSSSLATCLKVYDRSKLQSIVSGDNTDEQWSFLSCEFERAGTNASLTINVESVNGYRAERSLDVEGNEWNEMQMMGTTVNYPCHESTASGVCMARFELYREVAMLGLQIEGEHCGRTIWQMSRSAAEVNEQNAKDAAESLQRALLRFVDHNCRSMRLGKTSHFSHAGAPVDTVDGTYTVDNQTSSGVRKYTVVVSGDRTTTTVTRIA